MWDLYKTQPIKLRHPAGIEISVAAVSPIEDGIAWWSANYLIAQGMTGGMPGGSGFPVNPVKGTPQWDKNFQGWKIIDGDNIYLFFKPDEIMIEEWEKNKKYVPSIEILHQDAIAAYGAPK